MDQFLRLPAVSLRAITVLPGMVIHFDLSRKKSLRAVEQAMAADQRVFLVMQKDPDRQDPEQDDLHEYGTIALVKQLVKLPGGLVRVMVEGVERGRLAGFFEETEYLLAMVEADSLLLGAGSAEDPERLESPERSESPEHPESRRTAYPSAEEQTAMQEILQETFAKYSEENPKVAKAVQRQVEQQRDLLKLIYEMAAGLPLTPEQKQAVLDTPEVKGQFQVLMDIMQQQIGVARIKTDLVNGVRSRLDKNQKEYVLREQMKYIRENLGDEEDADKEADDFTGRVKALTAGEEVKEKLRREIRRFKSMPASSQESGLIRSYIETMLDLPWDKTDPEKNDIKRARRILDEDHYGLKEVKEKVLEFLAVRCLTQKGDSPILCLVGPPGTGKTSIARSVARALDRKYVRVCLGGVRDEAEIRGHRRTYVGSMPGRIAEGLKSAGTANPLMLLDEIDKTGSDARGDTASALLEVLDSEQNIHFRDHYLEVPMDLSRVLFIATANNASEIPRPLLDRMEVVEINSYTADEKLHIAKEHLVKKQLEKNGLTEQQLHITTGALKKLIACYTREAGVRGLERRIGQLCRKSAMKLLEGETSVRVSGKNLAEFLGNEKYEPETVEGKDQVGIVNGLAWTSVGGTTLEIEVNVLPGTGKLSLTGKLGDVMKESAETALSYVRSISPEMGIDPEFYQKNDIHIHIPEGATPKDGPSAGITMTTALLSAVTGVPVRNRVAMTGEVTLRGRVLPIGGLKEKLLAAKAAGIEKVLVPQKNMKDVEEMSEEIISGLEIVPVEHMRQVIEQSLTSDPTASSGKKRDSGASPAGAAAAREGKGRKEK